MRISAFILAGLLSLGAVSGASAVEYSTLVEQDAGCPAVLPTSPVDDTNVVVLDTSSLSKLCIAELRRQNGDDGDTNDDC